jgi:hypothetical protein
MYLSDDVVSPFLPPHLAPGVRRCSAIALRLGGAFEFCGLPPSSFVANNEILQQTSAYPCSSGGIAEDAIALTIPPNPFSGRVFISRCEFLNISLGLSRAASFCLKAAQGLPPFLADLLVTVVVYVGLVLS